jgi:hypothetical protein
MVGAMVGNVFLMEVCMDPSVEKSIYEEGIMYIDTA